MTQNGEDKKPPYWIYGVIIVGIILICLLVLAVRDTDQAIALRHSIVGHVWMALVSVITATVCAILLRDRVSKLIGWACCCLVGGATTLITNPAEGLLVGTVIGGTIVPGGHDRMAKLAAMAWRTLLPTVVLGGAWGALTGVGFMHFGGRFGSPLLVTCVLAGVLVLCLTLRLTSTSRRWHSWFVAGCLFLLCTASVGSWAAFEHSRVAVQALPAEGYSRYGIGDIVALRGGTPAWLHQLTKDWSDCSLMDVRIDSQTPSGNIRLASQVPGLASLSVGRGSVSYTHLTLPTNREV